MTAEITFTLPRPPSANNRLIPVKGRMVPARPYLDWQEAARADAIEARSKAQRPWRAGALFPGPVAVTYAVGRSDRRRYDLDNIWKCCGDVLSNVIYRDDSHIHRLVGEKEYGWDGVRVTVRSLAISQAREAAE